MSTPLTDTDLHAFVDGRLPPGRAAEVEAFLARHPEKAAEIAHWQRQNEAINALFAPLDSQPLPERLRPRPIAARLGSRLRWPQLAAAATVLLALGGAIGWAGRDLLRPAASELLIADAVAAHALYVKENRHAVEVAATDRDHLVTWLSNRIDRPVTPPDLTAEGFSLVGGRLLPGYEQTEAGPAALLMYENAAAERVTVYITAASPGKLQPDNSSTAPA
ncbi:MAG: anti-sigma factor [Devosia sp.]|nr:anti-sigma factor [Devosia sp.]